MCLLSNNVVSNLALSTTISEVSTPQSLMHGWSGAMFTVVNSGNPGKGFVSGFFSSLTASSVQNLGGGKISTLIGSTLAGGVGAAVVGGDFYQGATFGLISGALNHLAHDISGVVSSKPSNGPTKEDLKIKMYEEYAAGRCTQVEYLYALDIIDNNPIGVLQNVWEFHKIEIATTVSGIGLTKFFGTVMKAGGWTSWLNKGNWWRYGMGPHNGQMVKRLAWGAHPAYLNNVPKFLRPLNQWIRGIKNGHYNIK